MTPAERAAARAFGEGYAAALSDLLDAYTLTGIAGLAQWASDNCPNTPQGRAQALIWAGIRDTVNASAVTGTGE